MKKKINFRKPKRQPEKDEVTVTCGICGRTDPYYNGGSLSEECLGESTQHSFPPNKLHPTGDMDEQVRRERLATEQELKLLWHTG